MQALGGQPGGRLPGVGTEEAALCGHSIPHAGGVGLGALDGFGHDLHAHQLPAPSHHGQADGTHAAVEVQQQVIRGQLGVLCGNAVQPLGGQRVHLVERQRPQLHRNPAERIFDVARPVQGVGLGAQDHVGVFAVDIEQDGGNVRKLLPQTGAQRIGVGEVRASAHQTHHDLSAVRAPPQEDVPYQAPAGLFVVRLDAVFGKEPAQCIADVVEHAGLQFAVRAGHDAVSAPGVKANAGVTVLVQPYRELDLVAVAVHLRGGADVQHRHVQPTDAAEGIGNILLLGTQLGGVIQMPQAAAAAGSRHGTVHWNAVRRGGAQMVQNAKGVALAVLYDAHIGFVTGGGTRHKNGLAVRAVGHTAAVAGKPLDAQGQDLVLL